MATASDNFDRSSVETTAWYTCVGNATIINTNELCLSRVQPSSSLTAIVYIGMAWTSNQKSMSAPTTQCAAAPDADGLWRGWITRVTTQTGNSIDAIVMAWIDTNWGNAGYFDNDAFTDLLAVSSYPLTTVLHGLESSGSTHRIWQTSTNTVNFVSAVYGSTGPAGMYTYIGATSTRLAFDRWEGDGLVEAAPGTIFYPRRRMNVLIRR